MKNSVLFLLCNVECIKFISIVEKGLVKLKDISWPNILDFQSAFLKTKLKTKLHFFTFCKLWDNGTMRLQKFC